MVKLNYECLMGQPMRIMWAQRHLTRGSTCVGNLFIENVDKSIDSMGLFELFPISKKVLLCRDLALICFHLSSIFVASIYYYYYYDDNDDDDLLIYTLTWCVSPEG